MTGQAWSARVRRAALVCVLFLGASVFSSPASAQRFLLDPTETTSFLTHSASSEFGVCGIPMVDRGDLPTSPFTDARLNANRVLAGFNNFYRPGADPFPCNHSLVNSWAGIVKFGIPARQSTFANRRLTLAVLRISEAVAFREGGTINRTPACSGTGCIRSTNAMCRFQVAVMQQPVEPIAGQTEQVRLVSGRFSPRTILSRPRAIEIAGTGLARPINIDITREFRGWAIDGVEPGIVIFSDDRGVQTNDFATDCRVMFRFQLDVGVSD